MAHVLLTSLGTTTRLTEYQLHGQTATGLLTPLALVKLLDHKPERVITVVTAKAKQETWAVFQNEMCQTLGFLPESPIEIPEGHDSVEIRQILELVATSFPEGADLTLDITQGMRHLPFFFYAVALYLTSLRGVKLRGAYYGMWEAEGNPKPIIDLQPLLELPDWFHAVRMFRDEGATLSMARLITPLGDAVEAKARQEQQGTSDANRLHRQSTHVKRVGQLLKEHAFAYEAALPLELGKTSGQLIEPILELGSMDLEHLPPLASELCKAVADVASTRNLVKNPPRKGKWKQKIELDDSELQRQAGLIDFYQRLGQFPLAVGMMREWVISWIMLQSEQTANWYKHDERQRFERSLSKLAKQAQNLQFEITPAKKQFGDFWAQLTDLRNALHHHGMREDEISFPLKELKPILYFWDKLKTGQIELPEWQEHHGSLLVAIHSRRLGNLYSAIENIQPSRCVILTSKAYADSVPEIIRQTTFRGPVKEVMLNDKPGEFGQIAKASSQVQPWLLEANEVLVGMTGGTELMGLAVQQVVEEARKMWTPVRRFVQWDRRSLAQQEDEPFAQCECYWLDPETKHL